MSNAKVEKCVKSDNFYDICFSKTMPFLALFAMLCLSLAKVADFLVLDANAKGYEAGEVFVDGDFLIEDNKESIKLEARGEEKVEDEKNNQQKNAGQRVETKKNANDENKKSIEEAGKNNDERKITSVVRQEAESSTKTQVVANIENPKQPDRITINGRSINIFQSYNTMTDSGNLVARYKEKFLYGHNVAEVFASLAKLQSGDRFIVYQNGKEERYEVAKIETLTKNRTADFMGGIIQARYKSVQYGLAIMTCSGEPRPNRDSTHRLLLFANKV